MQRRRGRMLAQGLGLAAAFGVLIALPQTAAEGVRSGLTLCGQVILPSLFPFFVCSNLFVLLGFSARVSARFGGLAARLLRLPPNAGSAFVIGMTGGYPAGAQAVGLLYERGELSRDEAEHALESAEKKRDDLIKKGEEELENARRQAHDLMQQVQNEAYSLTDELRRIQKDEKTSAAQRAVRAREIARRDTETLLKKTDAKPQPVKEFVPLKEVQIGQEVVIADLGQTATVTARPDRSGMVEVRAGIMKTKVPLTNLRAPDKMEKRKPAEPRRSTRVQLDKSRKTSMELNLLGYTVDEALNEVDKFLDSGMLRGQSTLYIIHGNGTGALRTAIQKHLRTHKAVKSFRLGRYGEGESGVTVVELK